MLRLFISLLLCYCLIFHSFVLDAHAQIDKEEETLQEKNPWLAFGMSFIVPGAGQIYVDEDWWPGAIILVGITVGIVSFIFVDQARIASLHEGINPDGTTKKNPDGTVLMVTDARLEMLTLILQIGLPSLWIWNFGDAFKRAEEYNKKVTGSFTQK